MYGYFTDTGITKILFGACIMSYQSDVWSKRTIIANGYEKTMLRIKEERLEYFGVFTDKKTFFLQIFKIFVLLFIPQAI